MSVSVGGKIITNGLVIHYDALNGKSYPGSGTSWIDLTPYDNTGNLAAADNPVIIQNGYASFVADKAGSNSQYMSISSISEINNTTDYVTIDMWAKMPSNLGDNGSTANAYIFGFSTYGVSFRESGGDYTVDGEFGFTTSNNDIFGISDLPYITGSLVNKWNHYSFVMCSSPISSGSQKMYINSTPLVLSQVRGTDMGRSFSSIATSNLSFGTRGSAAADRCTTYDAALIKVYNRELTQAEVTQNFNAHKGRFNIY
jgi:hypothetical protein